MQSATINKTAKIATIAIMAAVLIAGFTSNVDAGSKKVVYKFVPKRVEKDNARDNRQVNQTIDNRIKQLQSLISYWDDMGNKQKADEGRKILASVQGAQASANPDSVQNLETLETGLDKIAVEKKTVLYGYDFQVKGGSYVYANRTAEFYSDGLISTDHSFTGRSATVTIRARGDFAAGAPAFALTVGKVNNSGEIKLTQENSREYSFNMTYEPGKQIVELLYTNDYWSSKYGDRNLFIETITIVERSWVAPK